MGVMIPFEAESWMINGVLVVTIPKQLRDMNASIKEKVKYKLWIEVSA